MTLYQKSSNHFNPLHNMAYGAESRTKYDLSRKGGPTLKSFHRNVSCPRYCHIKHLCNIKSKSVHKGVIVMTKFFSKNSHCNFDLDPIMLKRELLRGIITPNTCVKLY